MLPTTELEGDLNAAIAELAQQPLAALLNQQGILRGLARDLLLRRLLQAVQFNNDEQEQIRQRLWEGQPEAAPKSLTGNWLAEIPENQQEPMQKRWNQLCLQKLMEERYSERVEPYMLERRDALEQVVFGMIRVRSQGTAEELYLRLIDDDDDFSLLAKQFSIGEEQLTHGLVGPMAISQAHPRIQTVLNSLTVGDIHPPLLLEQSFLILRLEHRKPAALTDATRTLLLNELFQQDLNTTLDTQLDSVYPQLIQVK
jgi:parvulin-like peptidyl-prolyl isomerase